MSADDKRLGGKSKKVDGMKFPTKLHVHKLNSMSEAVERFKLGRKECWKVFRKHGSTQEDVDRLAGQMMRGDDAIERITAHADRLMDAAMIHDPRLVRRSGWVRAEDGIDGCPALISQGEENPFLDRRKMRVADAATLEPVRIVISTDSKHTSEAHAAAWIAAAKLAQQFRPLEVWWQGAWLKDMAETSYARLGHAFLVPLVQGDMDFSRLQFVLSNADRDHVSFNIMFGYSIESKETYGGAVGPESFLENTFDYVKETGIEADDWSIAYHAAHWAGLERIWTSKVNGNEAEQRWSDKKPDEWKPVDEATRRRWEQDRKASEKAEAQKAAQRLASTT